MTDFQQEPNTTQKLWAALSYISYFFLPIIFPLVVWIVGADRPFIKRHAKRAFWSQLIPMIFILVLLLAIGITGSFNPSSISWGWMTIALVSIAGIVTLISLIYNLVNAVRVLVD